MALAVGAALGDVSLDSDLFRDRQRVIQLDPKISDRALRLRMAEQALEYAVARRSGLAQGQLVA